MTRTRRQKRLSKLRQEKLARLPDTTECPTPGKRKYVGQSEANRALGVAWRTQGASQRPVRAYKCECGAWHLTKRP